MTREIEPLVNALIQAVKMERDLFNETSDDYSTEALMLAKERTALCKKALLEARTPPEATAVHGTIWVVMNEGNPELACGWPEGAHEHINDAIQHDIEGAAQWVVREYVPMICAEHDWRDEKEFVSCKRCHTTFAKRDLPSSTPVEPQGWQPIETAPADTDVLLYCPDRHYTNPERVELGQAKNTKGGSAHSWATHWMPLPSAPSTKAGS